MHDQLYGLAELALVALHGVAHRHTEQFRFLSLSKVQVLSEKAEQHSSTEQAEQRKWDEEIVQVIVQKQRRIPDEIHRIHLIRRQFQC